MELCFHSVVYFKQIFKMEPDNIAFGLSLKHRFLFDSSVCACVVCEFLRMSHLVFIVEQFGELGHGARGQLGIVLVVDQMDDGRLQLLRWLGQPLDIGHLGRVDLSCQDFGAGCQGLWEHGGPHPLVSGGGLHFH